MLKAFTESEHKLKNLNMYPLSAKMALRGILDNDQKFIAASGIEEVKAALQKKCQRGTRRGREAGTLQGKSAGCAFD